MREIEIFLTLAEELHFSRTAERLGVSPGRVSQAVKKQERLIGGPLFDRTTRTVRLSPLGEQLYRALERGHRQITEGIEAARATARGTRGTLTLGTMGPYSLQIERTLELFRARHPDARVRHREIQPASPLDLLLSGDVDLVYVWLPVEEPGLTVVPTAHVSELLLMVGAGHPFARRESVCLEDFGDCAVVEGGSIPATMEEALNPRRTPSGRPVPRGPRVTTWQEALSVVASGQAVAAVPAETPRFYAWPSLVYLPIRDAPPCRWALAWRTAAATPLIRAYAGASADADRFRDDPRA
ncbi:MULTISPECIES: LysR family transcriptional regulator [unclassified Streptomyces]|uniref:LysR family transcriptional regulator n=1 Tax=unclassified Streptomyces TaxID=2593676 RepID=UPI001F54450C|nr:MULTISPECIES: LysR family transcriptional regulator [unclassified Streptomyces]